MHPPRPEVEFLALLVHRGHLTRAEAEPLMPALARGEPLDRLLAGLPGWSAEQVERLRRTNAGQIPEIPGFDVMYCLGQGGTADVWRAREHRTGRVLALKVLRPEAAKKPATLAAFVAEAKLLERLSHPHLVRGYGVARFKDTYFCKLEALEGRTLLELLDAGQTFGEADALRIALAVAEVMRLLESERIVHRDLKPGNVMLCRGGRVVLIDLGFAATAGARAAGKSAVGTVAYLPPEAARGGAEADARSDIYSLGASLFQIAAGRLPFEAQEDRELLRMHIMERLKTGELKRRGLSPHLQYFVEKMMAKELEHRFQSWAELIETVRGHLAGREELEFDVQATRRRRT